MPTVEFTVTFRDRDLPGVLDMLRYEGGTVVNWTRDPDGGRERYKVTLRVTRNRYVPDRWNSFGLYPRNESK